MASYRVSERVRAGEMCQNAMVRARRFAIGSRVGARVASSTAFLRLSKRYDGDIVMIASSCVRVRQYVVNAKEGGSADPWVGRSRRVLTTEMHALIDADGRPTGWNLPPVRPRPWGPPPLKRVTQSLMIWSVTLPIRAASERGPRW